MLHSGNPYGRQSSNKKSQKLITIHTEVLLSSRKKRQTNKIHLHSPLPYVGARSLNRMSAQTAFHLTWASSPSEQSPKDCAGCVSAGLARTQSVALCLVSPRTSACDAQKQGLQLELEASIASSCGRNRAGPARSMSSEQNVWDTERKGDVQYISVLR